MTLRVAQELVSLQNSERGIIYRAVKKLYNKECKKQLKEGYEQEFRARGFLPDRRLSRELGGYAYSKYEDSWGGCVFFCILRGKWENLGLHIGWVTGDEEVLMDLSGGMSFEDAEVKRLSTQCYSATYVIEGNDRGWELEDDDLDAFMALGSDPDEEQLKGYVEVLDRGLSPEKAESEIAVALKEIDKFIEKHIYSLLQHWESVKLL